MSPERRRKQLSPVKLDSNNGDITAILTEIEQSELKQFLAGLYPKISIQRRENLDELGAIFRFQSKGRVEDIQDAVQRWNQALQTATGWVVMLLRIAELDYFNTNQNSPSTLTITDTIGNLLRGATPEDYARFDYHIDALTAKSLQMKDPGDAFLKQHLQDLLSVDQVQVTSRTLAESDIGFGP